MDAIGGNHKVGLDGCAVGELDADGVAALLQAAGAVAGMDDDGGRIGGEEIDEVGAVHAEVCVPAVGVRQLHRRDRRTVVATTAPGHRFPWSGCVNRAAPWCTAAPRSTVNRWAQAGRTGAHAAEGRNCDHGTGVAPGAVGIGGAAKQAITQPPKRLPAHYLWTVLIARIYEVFPLICPICAGQMRIIAFITVGAEVRKFLEHIGAGPQAPQITALPQHAARRCGTTVMRRWVRV